MPPTPSELPADHRGRRQLSSCRTHGQHLTAIRMLQAMAAMASACIPQTSLPRMLPAIATSSPVPNSCHLSQTVVGFSVGVSDDQPMTVVSSP